MILRAGFNWFFWTLKTEKQLTKLFELVGDRSETLKFSAEVLLAVS
ncbi:MAG: hypothetical protein HC942_17355 [Microcoleus sp. SU_5_6]|nr:hypothetical protein [Microcoleus sp. SU_5_6]